MKVRAIVVTGLALLAGSASAEMRTLTSQHLTLHTDLPVDAEIDALPGLFDQAFNQWRAYFGLDPKKYAEWHVVGCLLRDRASRERFITAGLMPADLWDFKSGTSHGKILWLYDQTSPYYRRHLLLHEGVHSFMNMLLGGTGPPWYTEGMAELLATHRLIDSKLTANYFPRSAREVPKLGRIDMVREGVQQGKLLSLQQVTAFDNRAHRDNNETYGWCWAAAAFLDGHPRYRDRFRQVSEFVTTNDFADRFQTLFAADRAILDEEWQIFLATLDYGYDFAQMELALAPGKPLDAEGSSAKVAVDRGWQSSGIRLEAGKSYSTRALGRYQVASDPKKWWCEPDGVTIRYVHGQPLGKLLGAVRPDNFDATNHTTPLAKPLPIGSGATITPEVSGTLYLRINDAPGELADNAGELTVTVKPNR
jgi:hypothetical protein